jgi:Zn-dependent protease with chaperone function
VSTAGAVASAAGAPAAIQLPNTGTGGHGAPSTSITFMLVAGAISALAGAAMFLMGRRRELEDDGLS